MKTKKEIKAELEKLCEERANSVFKSGDIDTSNQGWIEALAYVLDIDMCSCNKYPIENPYTSCTLCLDVADDELNRLNGS